VVGNLLEAIASGPTAPDPSRRADALALLKKYGLRDKIPASILAVLEQVPETPKPGDPIFAKVQNEIVGSGLLAAQAALVQARTEGFNPYLLRIDLQGEARQAAFELATFLRQAKQTGDPVPAPACIVAGGETTVTLRQVAGQALLGQVKGGRNTELALAAVTELVDFPGVMLVTMATDGEDGPTDAAGAVATGESYRRALGMNLHAENFLSRNDSYAYFAALDDLLKPGPTGTNANDLVFLFVL
jgi:hydroxypyruvate reductase